MNMDLIVVCLFSRRDEVGFNASVYLEMYNIKWNACVLHI